MGRMLLKIGTYIWIIAMLFSFKQYLEFPKILGFEADPFEALYWAFLTAVIFQLIKSLAENLHALGFEEMSGFLGVIGRLNKKYLLKNHTNHECKD